LKKNTIITPSEQIVVNNTGFILSFAKCAHLLSIDTMTPANSALHDLLEQRLVALENTNTFKVLLRGMNRLGPLGRGKIILREFAKYFDA
jgi:hypothetical protein